jgi:hypothetical protein
MTKASRGVMMLVALLAASLAAGGCKGKKDTGPAGPGPGGPPQGGFPQGRGMGGRGPASPIRQIMEQIGGRSPDSLSKALGQELKADTPAWETIQPQAAEYAKLAADLGKLDPPRGSKESWSQLTISFAESATALDKAAQAKDLKAARGADEKLGSACMDCHRAHRGGPGGPGGRGPGGPPGR